MNIRFLLTLVSIGFLSLLIIGCGDDAPSPHGGIGGAGGGGDMNYEQQALKMEQDDLAKLNMGENPYADKLEESGSDIQQDQVHGKAHGKAEP